MPSRKSGGSRAVDAKHLERDAKRPENFPQLQRRDFAKVTRGKRGIELAMAVADHAARWAGKDPGMPPEQAREQQIRAAQTLGKLSDPEAKIRELTVMVSRLTAALKRVKDGSDALPVPSGGDSGGGPGPH